MDCLSKSQITQRVLVVRIQACSGNAGTTCRSHQLISVYPPMVGTAVRDCLCRAVCSKVNATGLFDLRSVGGPI